MLRILWKSIVAPLEVFQGEDNRNRLPASSVTVLLAALLGSVVMPIANYLIHKDQYKISLDMSGMLVGLLVSIATWLTVCALFWLLSKVFQKELSFGRIASIWGLSYMPNILCLILYTLLLLAPSLYRGSDIAAFAVSTLFILCLVWKSIFYFIFVRFVFRATLGEFFKMTAVTAIVFTVLLFIGTKAGIQVPML